MAFCLVIIKTECSIIKQGVLAVDTATAGGDTPAFDTVRVASHQKKEFLKPTGKPPSFENRIIITGSGNCAKNQRRVGPICL